MAHVGPDTQPSSNPDQKIPPQRNCHSGSCLEAGFVPRGSDNGQQQPSQHNISQSQHSQGRIKDVAGGGHEGMDDGAMGKTKGQKVCECGTVGGEALVSWRCPHQHTLAWLDEQSHQQQQKLQQPPQHNILGSRDDERDADSAQTTSNGKKVRSPHFSDYCEGQSAPSNTQANPKVVSIDSSFYPSLLAPPGLAYCPPLNNGHAMRADGNEVDDVKPIDLSLKSKPSASPKLTSVYIEELKCKLALIRHFGVLNPQSFLAQHKYNYSDERRFTCDICPKAFKRKEALTEHRRLHTGEKPFECDKCFKRFSYRGSHYRHTHIHCPMLGKL
ncbi:zinc finger E-box-binding homeobox 1-like [Procambarus clarkii]|uniref:zinc finger E-box-binding homeobox 1-like n=1 Tax=Procambarus clarkii TaxID=6728 RepID=UPI0037424410